MNRKIFALAMVALMILPLALFSQNGAIQGTIAYTGDQAGPIVVATLAIPPDLNAPLKIDTLMAPGAFSFENLTDGTYFVAAFMDVNMDGFPGFDEPVGLYPGAVTVENSSSVTDVDFAVSELPQGSGAIRGQVHYTGAFTGEVHVYALGMSKTPFTSANFTWGGDNVYSLDGLFGGEYLVVAFLDVNGNGTPELDEPVGMAEQKIAIDEGEIKENVDITLFDADMHTGSISGVAVYNGLQTGDIHVAAVGLSLTPLKDVVADAQTGEFAIPHLAPGTYHLFAYVDADSSGGFDLGEPFSESYFDTISVAFGEEVSGVELTLVDRGTGIISGKVTYTGTEQGLIVVAGLGLSATPLVPGFAFRLGDGPYPYVIAGVAPGYYTVAGLINTSGAGLPTSIDEVLNGPLGFYLDDFIFVPPGDTVDNVDFTLEDSANSVISGTIFAPEGTHGSVQLFSLGISKTPFMKQTLSDAGAYQFSPVASGKYILGAFMDANGDGKYSMDEPIAFTQKLQTVYPNSQTTDINLYLAPNPLSDVSLAQDQSRPKDFALLPNYPNPFNPKTTFVYQAPRESHVTIKIYNLLGKEVATLVDEMVQAGTHQLVWDARNMANVQISSGIYICRMEAGNFSQSQKVMYVR
ncbi:MAG: T9SS type A sorting domain-containing protein [Calditrichaeota bacterium]|nr:T9SS type A sorting domain-containing protein [Calditrichota bacterium]